MRKHGSQSGTVMVKDINPGSGNSTPNSMEALNDLVFFRADDGSHGQELWKSDATELGTVMVKDITTSALGSRPSGMTASNGVIFFNAYTPETGRELWKSDGTQAGTQLILDIRPGTAGSGPTGITGINGLIFFQANDGTHGVKPWKSNGTAPGTLMVKDINPNDADSNLESFISWANRLYFTADDGTHRKELWALDMQNQPPSADAAGPYAGVEGSAIALSGSVVDDDNVITVKWIASSPVCAFSNPEALLTHVTCGDNGVFSITLEVRDWWNAPATDQATVTLTNAPPQNMVLNFAPSPAFLGSPVTAGVQFNDPGSADVHAGAIHWGEGPAQNMTVDQAANLATASHVYTAFGRYTVQVTITDDDGASAQVTDVIVARAGVFLPVMKQ
jgi:ELWxxDGT repeat protein